MAQKKILKSKHTQTPAETDGATSEEELKDAPILGDKKAIDIESALEPAAIIDEKEVEDVPVPTEDGEESGDEVSLDDEELNPFGDKWEL